VGFSTALRLSDIYLETGEVFIAAKTNTLSRILRLEASQVEPLKNYIAYERPLLMKRPTDRLFLSKLGEPVDKDCLHYLLKRSRDHFPGKVLHCATVRQSVINKFREGWNIREIQLFSGIKYLTTI
jgi:site-specific recombinase XerD